MLGCAVVPAHAGLFSSDSKPAAKVEEKSAAAATTLEDSIRQAQMLRLAGLYPDAIRHLSQLMMVASDDGRVISEYGKTLAAMGRASDAVNFLTRAQQLQPGDWTIYSALGVAYDQIGDQKGAQAAYEHALTIKPDESSVLNNYALSRMLAKDPEMAGKLAARAESAGGMSEPKIARNIAMIRSLASETQIVASSSAPQPSQNTVAHALVTAHPLAPAAAPTAEVAGNAIAKTQPQTAQVQPQTAAPQAPDAHRVVMQRVPVDPLAGPVTAPTHAPRPLQATVAIPSAAAPKPDAPANTPVAKIATTTPATPLSSALPPASVKTADTNKPVPVPVLKTLPPTPVKTAESKSAPVKAADAGKTGTAITPKMGPPTPVKAAEANKPASAPTVLPVKTADVKPTLKSKDGVPGLRMSANAY